MKCEQTRGIKILMYSESEQPLLPLYGYKTGVLLFCALIEQAHNT